MAEKETHRNTPDVTIRMCVYRKWLCEVTIWEAGARHRDPSNPRHVLPRNERGCSLIGGAGSLVEGEGRL